MSSNLLTFIDPAVEKTLDDFGTLVKQKASAISTFSRGMIKELWQLKNAKRAKVSKLTSAQRKLKYSSETFLEYIREVDSLFGYLEHEDLNKKIEKELTQKPATPQRKPTPPLSENTTSGGSDPQSGIEETPESTCCKSCKSLLVMTEQLKMSLARTNAAHETFVKTCSETEETCKKGAERSQDYVIKTEKKISDRYINGRNLAANQFVIGGGAIVTLIILIILLAKGTVSYNAGIATAVAVALLVIGSSFTVGIVALVLLIYRRVEYNEIRDHFREIERGFIGLDDSVCSIKYLELGQIHAHVEAIESLLTDAEKWLKEEDTEENRGMLLRNFIMIVQKGNAYQECKKKKTLFTNLQVMFDLKETLGSIKQEETREKRRWCGCLFSRTAEEENSDDKKADDDNNQANDGNKGADGNKRADDGNKGANDDHNKSSNSNPPPDTTSTPPIVKKRISAEIHDDNPHPAKQSHLAIQSNPAIQSSPVLVRYKKGGGGGDESDDDDDKHVSVSDIAALFNKKT